MIAAALELARSVSLFTIVLSRRIAFLRIKRRWISRHGVAILNSYGVHATLYDTQKQYRSDMLAKRGIPFTLLETKM